MGNTAPVARATYGDYVTKRVGRAEGRYEIWVFKICMLTGMLLLMVPWGHVVHGVLPADAFAQAAPAYGTGWVAAMAVRLVVGDPIVALVASRLVSRLDGDRSRSVAMALTNILVMATIMSLYGVVVGGADDILGAWVPTLPAIWIFAFCLNLFLVGPVATWITLKVARPARAALAQAHAKA